MVLRLSMKIIQLWADTGTNREIRREGKGKRCNLRSNFLPLDP